MLYAKVLSVVFVVFNSMVLFDFYLHMLAMYGLCLQRVYFELYLLLYSINIWLCKGLLFL